MRSKKPTSIIVLSSILILLIFSSCSTQEELLPTPTIALSPSPSPEVTQTVFVAPDPPGTISNPLTIGVLSLDEESTKFAAANDLALQLTAQTGYSFDVKPFPGMVEFLAGIQNSEVEIFWLQPVPYLWAAEKELAIPLLLSNHYGYYEYGIQFFSHTLSGFEQYVDTASGLSTQEAANALTQFSGKRPCWVSKDSLSGYVVPESFLNQNQILTQEAAITQSHSALIRALYITGICDFGASYAFSGDPRTASNVISDLSDVNEKIVPIWVSDPIIPNLNLSIHASVPDELREELMLSFLVLIKTEEGKQLIGDMNDYTIDDLMIINDSLYDPLREVLQYSPMTYEEIIFAEQD